MRDRNHKYPVNLTLEERALLNRLTVQGKIQVRKLKRAKILLLADEKHSQGYLLNRSGRVKQDLREVGKRGRYFKRSFAHLPEVGCVTPFY